MKKGECVNPASLFSIFTRSFTGSAALSSVNSSLRIMRFRACNLPFDWDSWGQMDMPGWLVNLKASKHSQLQNVRIDLVTSSA
jgi:hypothetical protein